MRTILILLILCISGFNSIAQNDSLSAMEEIATFQKELNDEFRNPKESPLEPGEIKTFRGHDFFPVDLTFRVDAKLTLTEGAPFLLMKTTTAKLNADRVYGFIEFELKGRQFRLPVYQSERLMKTSEYADYLFFPFTDLTNGEQTYMGGRYIDLRIPKGDEIVIDFNRAYNPFCAYNGKYSCPLVPAKNQMDIAVPVGVKYVEKMEIKKKERGR